MKKTISIVVVICAFLIFLVGCGNNTGMEGTWVITNRSGNIPSSLPTEIIFRDDGTGEFMNHLPGFMGGVNVSFDWNFDDGFHMSRQRKY